MLITGMSLTEILSLNMLVAFYLSGCVTRPVWYRLILARPEPPVQYPPSWSSQSWGQQTGIAQEPKQLGSCGSDSTSQHWDNRACLERDKSCQLMSHLILVGFLISMTCRLSVGLSGIQVFCRKQCIIWSPQLWVCIRNPFERRERRPNFFEIYKLNS